MGLNNFALLRLLGTSGAEISFSGLPTHGAKQFSLSIFITGFGKTGVWMDPMIDFPNLLKC